MGILINQQPSRFILNNLIHSSSRCFSFSEAEFIFSLFQLVYKNDFQSVSWLWLVLSEVCSTRISEEEIDSLKYLTVKQRTRSSILHVIIGSQRDDGASKVVWWRTKNVRDIRSFSEIKLIQKNFISTPNKSWNKYFWNGKNQESFFLLLMAILNHVRW